MWSVTFYYQINYKSQLKQKGSFLESNKLSKYVLSEINSYQKGLETVFVNYRQRINPFQNDKFFTFPKTRSLPMTISNLTKRTESSQNELKTLSEKEKLLILSNFSFSLSVFKRLVLQTCKNQGLFEKWLTLSQIISGFHDALPW